MTEAAEEKVDDGSPNHLMGTHSVHGKYQHEPVFLVQDAVRDGAAMAELKPFESSPPDWDDPSTPRYLMEMQNGINSLHHLIHDMRLQELALGDDAPLVQQQLQNSRTLEPYLLKLKTSLKEFETQGRRMMSTRVDPRDEEQLQRLETMESQITWSHLQLQDRHVLLEAQQRIRAQMPHYEDFSDMQTDLNADSGYASVTTDKARGANSTGDASDAVPAEVGVSNDDDVKTVYSDASSVAPLTKETYLCELADSLFNSIFSEQRDEAMMDRISDVLSGLLQAFALKVGHDAPSQMHRDVMVFVYKYRRDIVHHFRKRCIQEKEIPVQPLILDNPEMSWDQRMAFWNDRLEAPENENLQSLEDTMHLDGDFKLQNDEGLDIPALDTERSALKTNTGESGRLSKYREFIFQSTAYQWLVENLHKELTLASSEPNAMDAIRRMVMELLPHPREISRKKSTRTCTMKFAMDWDPLAFIDEQMYSQPPKEVIGKIITITGSSEETQALPCEAYLAQTWPSTGICILGLIKDALGGPAGARKITTLPDGTQVSAQLHKGACTIEASGPARSIAEIGEQVAWLGAALRSSPYDRGVTYCVPVIDDARSSKASQGSDYDAVLWIDFPVTATADVDVPPAGLCWYSMFRNPVVVEGYPVLRRPEGNTGLEISLDMMAGLLQTCYANTINKQLVLKGFSMMLIPTQNDGDLLTWHLIYNKDGQRISYLDNTLPLKSVSTSQLRTNRHIVGWCSDAKSYVGSATADYTVERSWLPQPQGADEHIRASIHAGFLIRGSDLFAIGHKDTPVHVSPQNGYMLKLRSLAKRFVVLWDEEDKRGWLVNGTSALLHILRASLQHDGDGDFKEVFLFKPDQMVEPPEQLEPNYAINVLLDPTNKKLKLYPGDKDNYLRVEDRVESIYNVLEQLFDYQTGIVGHNLHDQIVGWDFKDLAIDQDPFHLRIANLKTYGRAWTQLTRETRAIVLFGRGFGDLIQPAAGAICGSCTGHWTQLPKEKYYLAATVPVVKRIMDRHGSQKAESRKLTENLIWHNPGDMFCPCQCGSGDTRDRHDPVQVLMPSTNLPGLVLGSPEDLGDGGAVIFGQNSTFNWHWSYDGVLTKGEAPSPLEEPDGQFFDSGIGESSNSSMESSVKPTSADNLTTSSYRVGIVCALPKELKAMRALFDERHGNKISIPSQDTNHYALGRIGQHKVVAACLPSGDFGTNSAADVVSHMVRTFPVKFCLLVGIGGGVPSKEHDIRLGDIVVSQSGVIQYDFGKKHQTSEFEARGIVHRPPRYLMTAISSLEADPDHSPELLQHYINQISDCRPEYKHPGRGKDVLFAATYAHETSAETCAQCDGRRLRRTPRRSNVPKIHYGLIASGNQVMKDAIARDQLAMEKKFLCFEMEAAGVMSTVDCLVIRGICDYADSHKNDVWQEYASATAAAYAKLLLSVVRPDDPGASTGHLPMSLPSTSEQGLQAAPDTLRPRGSKVRQLRSSAR